MKKLVLLGLAILISMSIVAAASMSTIQFSGDISNILETKLRTGYFVWGVKNRASPGLVTITQAKNIGTYTILGNYWTDGYAKFNLKNPSALERFDMQLTETDYPNNHWDYEIYGTNINGCSVAKTEQNKYEITCNNAMIETTVYVPEGAGQICSKNGNICVVNYYIKQIMPWTFTATIQI